MIHSVQPQINDISGKLRVESLRESCCARFSDKKIWGVKFDFENLNFIANMLIS